MSLPPSCAKHLSEGNVCRLKKILIYPQSLIAWFGQFGKAVKGHKYTQSQANHIMFYRHSKEGKIVILIIYVDDIILIYDDHVKLKRLKRLKRVLADNFEIKDLEALKYFLGMDFAWSKNGVFVCQ